MENNENENINNSEEYSNNTSNNEIENNSLPPEIDQAAERRNKIIGFLIIVAIIIAIKFLGN